MAEINAAPRGQSPDTASLTIGGDVYRTTRTKNGWRARGAYTWALGATRQEAAQRAARSTKRYREIVEWLDVFARGECPTLPESDLVLSPVAR